MRLKRMARMSVTAPGPSPADQRFQLDSSFDTDDEQLDAAAAASKGADHDFQTAHVHGTQGKKRQLDQQQPTSPTTRLHSSNLATANSQVTPTLATKGAAGMAATDAGASTAKRLKSSKLGTTEHNVQGTCAAAANADSTQQSEQEQQAEASEHEVASEGDGQQVEEQLERVEGEEGTPDKDAPLTKAEQAKLKRRRVLSHAKLQRMQEAADRRGIVYVSRIPPHMKPMKLKQMLEEYGEVGRVYCAPEDLAARRLRKKQGGNSGKNFTEGWVEFTDKRVAKRVAAMLNGQAMGGKRRSAYHFDLWVLKYLPKFKWDHLTDEINYQRAVREQKLVAEISAAKRERDFYLSRVDKAKAQDAMQERRQKKAMEAVATGQSTAAAAGPATGAAGSALTQHDISLPGSGAGSAAHKKGSSSHGGADGSTGGSMPGGTAGGATGEGVKRPKAVRHFGQRRAKLDSVSDANAPQLSQDVLMMLARKRPSSAV